MPDEHKGRVGRLKAIRSRTPDASFADVLTECQPKSHGSLVELACLDLIERVRLGSTARVEDYTQVIDRLDNPDDILDLLDAEICVRRELGETPCVEEIMQRYPNLRDEVARLFEIDDIEQEINTPARPPRADLPAVPGFELTKQLWTDEASVIYRGRTVSKRTDSLVRVFKTGSRDDQQLSSQLGKATGLQHPSSLPITHFNAIGNSLFYAMENPNAVPLSSLATQPVPGPTVARWLQSIAAVIAIGQLDDTDLGLVTMDQIVIDHADQAQLIGYGRCPASGVIQQINEFGCLLFHLLTSIRPDRTAIDVLPSDHPALSVEVDQPLEQILGKCLGIGPGPQYSDFTQIVDQFAAYLAASPHTPSRTHTSFVRRMLTD